jgi:predicted nucleic acid-binding protein
MALRAATERRIILIGSDLLLFEVGRLGSQEKREGALGALRQCHAMAKTVTAHLELAETLEARSPLFGRDALHVAIAALEGAEYFATCDRDVARASGKVQEILTGQDRGTSIVSPATLLPLLV